MHREIYEITNSNAIVHCHSPYTLGISIASKFEDVIEEAKIIVGDPIIIENVRRVLSNWHPAYQDVLKMIE
jgi:L-fuculose-phosphate aldolase